MELAVEFYFMNENSYCFKTKYKLLNLLIIGQGLILLLLFSPIMFFYRTPKRNINYIHFITIFFLINLILILLNYVIFRYLKSISIDTNNKTITFELCKFFKCSKIKYHFDELSYKYECTRRENRIEFYRNRTKIAEVSSYDFDITDIWDIERLLKDNVKEMKNN